MAGAGVVGASWAAGFATGLAAGRVIVVERAVVGLVAVLVLEADLVVEVLDAAGLVAVLVWAIAEVAINPVLSNTKANADFMWIGE